jgi:Carboxypeptidase regulatory-like domain
MRWTLVCLFLLTVTTGFPQQPQPDRGYRLQVTRSPIEDDIHGFVYDQTGHPVAGAAVVVKNMGSGAELMVIAGDDGLYKFNKLTTTDSYELSVTFPQFQNFDVKGVNIGWKLATRLDIVLRPK